MKQISFFILITISSFYNVYSQDIKPEISTYLGNEKRNYYGNEAPERLDTLWTLYLGEGISPAYGNPNKLWKGAGWTGQPLFIREGDKNFLILGAFDYNLKKINAETGKIVWEYKYDDIIKGTATFWENKKEKDPKKRYVILQGSRRGRYNKIDDEIIPSYRAISYMTGKELWRMNVKQTLSYSRDVDGSAIVINDTAYLALENGIFTVFNPDVSKAEKKKKIRSPEIYKEIKYYEGNDTTLHGDDLVSESSPTLLNNTVFTPAGSGRLYGYNIKKGKNTFELFLGTDLQASAPVTNDNCLILGVEKQYMPGPGGVMKINPYADKDNRIVWYYTTPNKKWYHWEGGIIGSVSINDAYENNTEMQLAVFIDVTGRLTVVNHTKIDSTRKCLAPDGKTWLPTPEVLFTEYIPGTISTPIIVKDKIVAATDNGIFLYKVDLKNMKLKLLDHIPDLEIDATPIAVDGKIYIASRNGYLYCLGKRK